MLNTDESMRYVQRIWQYHTHCAVIVIKLAQLVYDILV